MKIALAIIVCSYAYGECMEPYVFPERYPSHYECMIAGYEKSLSKMKEIGKRDINRDQVFFKFVCYEQERKPNIDELGT